MKQDYITTINQKLQETDDLALLDLIYQLLSKAGATRETE